MIMLGELMHENNQIEDLKDTKTFYFKVLNLKSTYMNQIIIYSLAMTFII